MCKHALTCVRTCVARNIEELSCVQRRGSDVDMVHTHVYIYVCGWIYIHILMYIYMCVFMCIYNTWTWLHAHTRFTFTRNTRVSACAYHIDIHTQK